MGIPVAVKEFSELRLEQLAAKRQGAYQRAQPVGTRQDAGDAHTWLASNVEEPRSFCDVHLKTGERCFSFGPRAKTQGWRKHHAGEGVLVGGEGHSDNARQQKRSQSVRARASSRATPPPASRAE